MACTIVKNQQEIQAKGGKLVVCDALVDFSSRRGGGLGLSDFFVSTYINVLFITFHHFLEDVIAVIVFSIIFRVTLWHYGIDAMAFSCPHIVHNTIPQLLIPL